MFTFLKKNPKCLYEVVEYSFVNPVEKILQSPKFFPRSTKKSKKIYFFRNFFFPRHSSGQASGQVECSFDSPAENFLLQVRKFFA